MIDTKIDISKKHNAYFFPYLMQTNALKCVGSFITCTANCIGQRCSSQLSGKPV